MLFLTILDTGIRVKEALTLEIRDVNFSENIITVTARKSETRNARFLPIGKRISRLLNELIKISQKNNSEYVFINQYGLPFEYLGQEALCTGMQKKQVLNALYIC